MTGDSHVLMERDRVGVHETTAGCTCGAAIGFFAGDARGAAALSAFGRHLVEVGHEDARLLPRDVVEMGFATHGATRVYVLGRTGVFYGENPEPTTTYRVLIPGEGPGGVRDTTKDALVNDVFDWELRVVA